MSGLIGLTGLLLDTAFKETGVPVEVAEITSSSSHVRFGADSERLSSSGSAAR